MYCVLLTMLLTTGLFAQKAQLTDYIVLHNNDTIYGKVHYINEHSVPRKFYKKLRITTADGKKKKFKRKDIAAFRVENRVYQSFWLTESTEGIGLFNMNFNLDQQRGKHHFLRVIETGPLGHYELEWFEQGNAALHAMALLKKESAAYFIRADQGIFGLKAKTVQQYVSDCTGLIEAIKTKKVEAVWQVVDFYNTQCAQ